MAWSKNDEDSKVMENQVIVTADCRGFCQRPANIVEPSYSFLGGMSATLPLLIMFAACILPPRLREAIADERGKRPARQAEAAPEDVLLNFLVATAAGDADRIEQLAVPHPDVMILSQGEHASPEALSAMRHRLPRSFSRLKIGDKVKLASDGTMVVDETRVNENRVEIMTPDAPLPFTLVREEGFWRVEADPIIQARLAARRSVRETGVDEWPEWSPVPALLEELDPMTEHAGLRIRVPRGYARLSDDNSAAQVWQGPERKDSTQANLSATIMTLTPDLAKRTLDELLTGSLNSVAKRRDRWRQGVIEHGLVGARQFVRARWTGVSKLSSREEYRRRAMRGIAYATIANGELILFMSQDMAVHASTSLPLAEASVLTARIIGRGAKN